MKTQGYQQTIDPKTATPESVYGIENRGLVLSQNDLTKKLINKILKELQEPTVVKPSNRTTSQYLIDDLQAIGSILKKVATNHNQENQAQTISKLQKILKIQNGLSPNNVSWDNLTKIASLWSEHVAIDPSERARIKRNDWFSADASKHPQLAVIQRTPLGPNCNSWISIDPLLKKYDEGQTIKKLQTITNKIIQEHRRKKTALNLPEIQREVYEKLQSDSNQEINYLQQIPIDFNENAKTVISLIQKLKSIDLNTSYIDAGKDTTNLGIEPLKIVAADIDEETEQIILEFMYAASNKIGVDFYHALKFLKLVQETMNPDEAKHYIDFKNIHPQDFGKKGGSDIAPRIKTFLGKVYKELGQTYKSSDRVEILSLAKNIRKKYPELRNINLEQYFDTEKYTSVVDLTNYNNGLKNILKTLMGEDSQLKDNIVSALDFFKELKQYSRENKESLEKVFDLDIDKIEFSKLNQKTQELVFLLLEKVPCLDNTSAPSWRTILHNPKRLESKQNIYLDSTILGLDPSSIPKAKAPINQEQNPAKAQAQAKRIEQLRINYKKVIQFLYDTDYDTQMFDRFSLKKSKKLRQAISCYKLEKAQNESVQNVLRLATQTVKDLNVYDEMFTNLYNNQVYQENIVHVANILQPITEIQNLMQIDFEEAPLTQDAQQILNSVSQNFPSGMLREEHVINVINEAKRATMLGIDLNSILNQKAQGQKITLSPQAQSFFDTFLEENKRLDFNYSSQKTTDLCVIDQLKNLGDNNPFKDETDKISRENIFDIELSSELRQQVNDFLATYPQLRVKPSKTRLEEIINNASDDELFVNQELQEKLQDIKSTITQEISDKDYLSFIVYLNQYYKHGGNLDNIDLSKTEPSKLAEDQQNFIRAVLRNILPLNTRANLKGIILDDFDEEFYQKLDFSMATLSDNFYSLDRSSGIRTHITNQKVAFNYFNDSLQGYKKELLNFELLTPLAKGRLIQDLIRYRQIDRGILPIERFMDPNSKTVGEPLNFQTNYLQDIKLDNANCQHFFQEDLANLAKSTFVDNFEDIDSEESIDVRISLLTWLIHDAEQIRDNQGMLIEAKRFPLDNLMNKNNLAHIRTLAHLKTCPENFFTVEKTHILRQRLIVDKANAGIFDFRGIYLGDQLELLKQIPADCDIITDETCFQIKPKPHEDDNGTTFNPPLADSKEVRIYLLQRKFQKAINENKTALPHKDLAAADTGRTALDTGKFDSTANIKVNAKGVALDDFTKEDLQRALTTTQSINPQANFAMLKFDRSNFIKDLDESLYTRALMLQDIYDHAIENKEKADLRGFILDGLNLFFNSEVDNEALLDEISRSTDKAKAEELCHALSSLRRRIDFTNTRINSDCFAYRASSKGIKETIIHDFYSYAINNPTSEGVKENSIAIPECIMLDGLNLQDINLALVDISRLNFKYCDEGSKEIRELALRHRYYHAILNGKIPDFRGIPLDFLDLSDLDLSKVIIDKDNFIKLENCIEIRENIIHDRFWDALLSTGQIDPKSELVPQKFKIYFEFSNDEEWNEYIDITTTKVKFLRNIKIAKRSLKQSFSKLYSKIQKSPYPKDLSAAKLEIDLREVPLDGLRLNSFCMPSTLPLTLLILELGLRAQNIDLRFDSSNFKDYSQNKNIRRALLEFFWKQSHYKQTDQQRCFEQIDKLRYADIDDIDKGILISIIENKAQSLISQTTKTPEGQKRLALTNAAKDHIYNIKEYISKDSIRDLLLADKNHKEKVSNTTIVAISCTIEKIKDIALFKGLEQKDWVGLEASLKSIFNSVKKIDHIQKSIDDFHSLANYFIEEMLLGYIKKHSKNLNKENVEIDFSDIPLREELNLSSDYLANGKFGRSSFLRFDKSLDLRTKAILYKLSSGNLDIRGIPLIGIDFNASKFRPYLKYLSSLITDQTNFIGRRDHTKDMRYTLIKNIAATNRLEMQNDPEHLVSQSLANRIREMKIPTQDLENDFITLVQKELQEYVSLTKNKRKQLLLDQLKNGSTDFRGIPLADIDFDDKEFDPYRAMLPNIIVESYCFENCAAESTKTVRSQIIKLMIETFGAEIAAQKIEAFDIPYYDLKIEGLNTSKSGPKTITALLKTKDKGPNTKAAVTSQRKGHNPQAIITPAQQQKDPNAETVVTPPKDPNAETVVTQRKPLEQTPIQPQVQDNNKKTAPLKRNSNKETVKTDVNKGLQTNFSVETTNRFSLNYEKPPKEKAKKTTRQEDSKD